MADLWQFTHATADHARTPLFKKIERRKEFSKIRTEAGTPVANHISMKVLAEFGRLAAVYLSFVGFLATEVALIVVLYRFLGII
jgi:hypothetical protein